MLLFNQFLSCVGFPPDSVGGKDASFPWFCLLLPGYARLGSCEYTSTVSLPSKLFKLLAEALLAKEEH